MSETPASATSTPNTPYTAAEIRHRIFSIVAASSGNLVEWFDFYVYAFTSRYFAPALRSLLLIALALAIVSFHTAVSGIVKAEMFPAEVRALGVGLAYAIANAIFGGSAEYVALGLKSVGHESAFYWYVTVMMAIAFLVALRLPKRPNYLHEERGLTKPGCSTAGPGDQGARWI